MKKGNVTVLPDESLGGVLREYLEVKRKARVGERIKTLKNCGDFYRRGDVGLVYRSGIDANVWADFSGNSYVHGDGNWCVGGDVGYVVLEPTDIVVINGERLQVVKRKAKVGERIIVTNCDYEFGDFFAVGHVGKVLRVDEDDGRVQVSFSGYGNSFVDDDGVWAVGRMEGNSEYAVLEPVGSSEIPDRVAEDLANLVRRVLELERRMGAVVKFGEEIVANVERIDAKLSRIEPDIRRVEAEARTSGEIAGDSPRDEIIERAKADVAEMLVDNYPDMCVWFTEKGGYLMTDECEFVVNRNKRTVIALIRAIGSKRVLHRGFARCAPGDVFNVHIGKAIALRRALNLPVPEEYLNAPRPKEPRAGDIVRYSGTPMGVLDGQLRKITRPHKSGKGWWFTNGMWDWTKYLEIIDDSRDGTDVSEWGGAA